MTTPEIGFDNDLRAIYFLTGHDSDWLAAVKQKPDGIVSTVYRFRYYDPEDPGNDAWSGKDKKTWYASEGKEPGKPTLELAMRTMQRIMDEMQALGFVPKGGIACKLVRGSMTREQFWHEFKKLPFVHTKTLRKGDPGFEDYVKGMYPK